MRKPIIEYAVQRFGRKLERGDVFIHKDSDPLDTYVVLRVSAGSATVQLRAKRTKRVDYMANVRVKGKLTGEQKRVQYDAPVTGPITAISLHAAVVIVGHEEVPEHAPPVVKDEVSDEVEAMEPPPQ